MKSTRAMAIIKTIKDLSNELMELVDTAPSIVSETDRYLQDIDHILVIEKGKLTRNQYMALVLERENVLSFRADTKRVCKLRTVVKDTQMFPSLQNLDKVMEHAESVCNKDNQTYTVRSETGLKLLQDIHKGKDLTKDKRYNLNIEVPLGKISSRRRGNGRRKDKNHLTKETVRKSKERLDEVLYGYCEESIKDINEIINKETKPLEKDNTSVTGKLSIKEFLERAKNLTQVETLDKGDNQPTEETPPTEQNLTNKEELQGTISIQEYINQMTSSKKVEKEVIDTTKVEEILKEPTPYEQIEFTEKPITTQHPSIESIEELLDRVSVKKGNEDNPIYNVNELRSVSEILSVNKVKYLVYAFTRTDNDTEFNQWVLDNEDDFTIYRAYAPIVEKLNSMEFYLTQEDMNGKPFAVYLEDDGTNVDIVDVAYREEDLNYIRDTFFNNQLSITKIPSYS